MCDNLDDLFKTEYEKYSMSPKATAACNDQFCATFKNGKLTQCKRNNVLYDFDNNTIKNKLNKNIIAIVLESPHKYEFDSSGKSLGPAQNTTGRLFFQHFEALFKKSKLYLLCKSGIQYNIVFINSVQYQTSCGNSLTKCTSKKKRDQIWLHIFTNDRGKKNFLARLECLKPTYIINLCTKGLYNLQLEVNNCILSKEEYRGIYTYGTHPSTWNFCFAKIF